MVDELLAAESFYYFPEPTYYRFPSNTDELFEEYINNPSRFKEYEISRDLLILRLHDLRYDLETIKNQGQSESIKHKYYYYKGMVDKLREIVDPDIRIGQYDLLPDYLSLTSSLDKIKQSLILTGEVSIKINLYYYFKGQRDIFRQLILNTPLLVRT